MLTGSGRGFDTWTAEGGLVVLVEEGSPPGWASELATLGHPVEVRPAFEHGFGHANLIVRHAAGVLAGAADPRGASAPPRASDAPLRHTLRRPPGVRLGRAVDTNFFGTVPMPDAGDPVVAPTSRRYGNRDVLACYDNMLHWAQTADGLGYDTMWLTEHHFQYEGYEVLPNLILFGMHAATRTENLRFGQMFNVVPQWHPLRLAEDFALADILTGGRMEFGVGRGTVPREAESLGTVVASGDNEMAAELDRINRERCSRRAWRSSSSPGATNVSPSGASTSRCPLTASPTEAAS